MQPLSSILLLLLEVNLIRVKTALMMNETLPKFDDPPAVNTVLGKIAELARLPENWDSYGSRPIQPAAIERTIELLRELSKFDLPLPQIFPVPGGGIQLEWQNAKCELEIEVRSDGSVEFLIVDEEGEMREGQISPYSLAEIYRLGHRTWYASAY